MSQEYLNIENKKCPKCGCTNWSILDGYYNYTEICTNCCYIVEIKKQDFVSNFQCPDCGCLEATLEENVKFIATRCKHCGKQAIVLEKYCTKDFRLESKRKQPALLCPKCGSSSISIGQKGYSLFTGLLQSNKTMNRCGNCGYKWMPKK